MAGLSKLVKLLNRRMTVRRALAGVKKERQIVGLLRGYNRGSPLIKNPNTRDLKDMVNFQKLEVEPNPFTKAVWGGAEEVRFIQDRMGNWYASPALDVLHEDMAKELEKLGTKTYKNSRLSVVLNPNGMMQQGGSLRDYLDFARNPMRRPTTGNDA